MKPIGVITLVIAVGAVLAPSSHGTPTPQELLKLSPSDGVWESYLGKSCSVDGTRAVIGAYPRWADVFDITTGEQLFRLAPIGGIPGQGFGDSVAISGRSIIVGSRGDDVNGVGSGSAYLFDASTGQQTFKLLPNDGSGSDHFGYDVAICGDRAVVGSPGDDDLGPASGSAYVFDTTTGQQLLKLLPSNGAATDQFGMSVSCSGNLAIVGAPYSTYGSAYIFDLTTGQELFQLVPSSPAAYANFGRSVALSGDRAVVGSPGTWPQGSRTGSAFVFDVTTGQELQELLAPGRVAGNQFGFDVSIQDQRIVVGAPFDEATIGAGQTGSAYVFETSTRLLLGRLLSSDLAVLDEFGCSVSVFGDRAVVGAFKHDDNGQNSGAAYVFDAMVPGVGYCFGDPGSGIPCPCGNDNDGSVPGSGCDNGVFASGAQLTAEGVASISSDSIVLHTTHSEPHSAGLYFQGNQQLSDDGIGAVFGNGLRCAGSGVVRLQFRFADAFGASSTTIPIGAQGGVSAGDTKFYQFWYRNVTSPPCGLGGQDFNTTNGYQLTWLP